MSTNAPNAHAPRDSVTGRETTGHEWDGIRELNAPLPRWWLYVFLATIVWGAGFALLYPTIPLGRTYFHGLLGYSSRAAVDHDVAVGAAGRADAMDRIRDLPLADIRRDAQLMEVAQVAGRIAFANNCAPCHGTAGSGRPGYPTLASDRWLWGGTAEAIQRTITYGIRSGHPDARVSEMPRFGADGILTPAQVGQVADFVLSLSGRAPAGADTAPGAKLFADNCAVCHGDKGQGNLEVGAPRLNGQVWLYGGDRAAIVRQVTQPRHGVMPAWTSRLDAATIKSLALYVHDLGGGQ